MSVTKRYRYSVGFTLVELLIVIVVVAILAALAIVAYNGMQARANDAKLRDGAAKVEKALKLWYTDTGEYPRGSFGTTSGLGSAKNCANGSGGWIASNTYGSPSVACTPEDYLMAFGYLPKNFMNSMPKNTYIGWSAPQTSMMLYPCNDPGEYALYWTLYAPTQADADSMTAAETAGCPSIPRTSYGQRAAKVIQF